jgi:hypothetical protein
MSATTAATTSAATSSLKEFHCHSNKLSSVTSFPEKARLLAIATDIIPALPDTLFNILPFNILPVTYGVTYGLDNVMCMFRREFINNHLELDYCERIFPYVYLEHAYEVTNNQALKPLLDYFKPTKKCLKIAWSAFSHARFHCAEYMPTDILELHGFDSLEEVDNVIENAFINRQKENGLERIKDVCGYINDANIICEATIASFNEDEYFHSVAPYLYMRRSVYRPLLFYIDYVLREDILNRFREMFYSLKYKQQFRHVLWAKVREPKIRAKYHPNNLDKLLEQYGDLDVDELDALMDQW